MVIFVGDTGTKIILNVGLDISAATLRQIKYLSPDSTVGAWTAAQETTTSISIVTTADTLDARGRWQLQVYIETPTWQRHGEICTLEVSAVVGT